MEEGKKDVQQATEAVPAKKKKTCNKYMPLVGGLALVLLVGAMGWVGYAKAQANTLSEAPLVMKTAALFNFTAVKVNDEKIPYDVYVEDRNVFEFFYNQQEGVLPATKDDFSDMTISRLMFNAITKGIADEWDIKVTEEDRAAEMENLIAEYGSQENVISEVKNNYGWDMDKYMKRVIDPIILDQKVEDAFNSREDLADYMTEEVHARHILIRVEEDSDANLAKQTAMDLIERLNNGEDFEALAKEFGSDGTAEVGGDLGWFGRGVMLPEFEVAAFALEAGEVTQEPVETIYGYHIVKVEEKRETKDYFSFIDQQFRDAEIVFVADINNPFDQAAIEAGLPVAQ